jgi:F0F1-type ATP synthase assembly protein I
MSDDGSLAKYAPYLSLGLEIAVGIALPILAGYWLDEYLGTGPWILLGGCVLGMVNVFVIIFRLNSKLNDDF